VDRDSVGGCYTEANAIAPNIDHRDGHIVADPNPLVLVSRKNQHALAPVSKKGESIALRVTAERIDFARQNPPRNKKTGAVRRRTGRLGELGVKGARPRSSRTEVLRSEMV